jgi:peptidoglycan/xylan/chitin deacetylase (PgdA/CDA1 family)
MSIRRTSSILLTFDVEEFDISMEFNQPLPIEMQMETGRKGLEIVSTILSENNIACTMFTTGSFAKAFPDVISRLAIKHEIASHSMNHSQFSKSDLLKSKRLLETIAGTPIEGIRMPRMENLDMQWLAEAGYIYDASVNPTFIPGRYNHLNLPRTIYREGYMIRIPSSVTPNLRIPLFWLSFKNFPYRLFLKLALQALKKDGYLVLYFHPWEFINLDNFRLPFYIKGVSGERLQAMIRTLIKDLQPHGQFETIGAFLRHTNDIPTFSKGAIANTSN